MTVATTDPLAIRRRQVKWARGRYTTSKDNLRRVVQMWTANKYSIGMVRQCLCLHRFKPPSGRQWTDAQVRALLDEQGLTTNAGELAEQLGRMPNPRPKQHHAELN